MFQKITKQQKLKRELVFSLSMEYNKFYSKEQAKKITASLNTGAVAGGQCGHGRHFYGIHRWPGDGVGICSRRNCCHKPVYWK